MGRIRARVRDSGVRNFEVRFNRVAWFSNFERNRWFLSLGAGKPESNELNMLLHASNTACHEMKQPELYVSARKQQEDHKRQPKRRKKGSNETAAASNDDNSMADCTDAFHISLAWSLQTQALNSGDTVTRPRETKNLSVDFDCVKVKIGNTITSLPLKARRMSQHSR